MQEQSTSIPANLASHRMVGRIDSVDVARGVAILAMAIFHFAWDLSQADLIATDVSNHPGWQAFARAIAASFLALVGVSLVLAHGAGIRRDTFLRRWLMVAGAAGLVSLGTWIALPDVWVFFGILHNIALSSLIGLALIRLPALLLAGLAALALTLPVVFRSSLFDSPFLIWTGLAQRVPDTVDFVALFPWLGCVLLGMAAAKLAQPLLSQLTWRATRPPAAWFARAGRHSLIIYLIHQPILLGLIWLYTAIAPVSGHADGLARFEAECVAVCRQSADREVCARGCACARAETAKDAELVAAIRAERVDARLTARLAEISKACLR